MKHEFITLVGSHLYGLSTTQSDKDFKGFGFEPIDHILGLKTIEQQDYKTPGVDDGPDKIEGTVFTIRRYLQLCLKSNPTVIEIAFAKEQSHIYSSELGLKICKFVRENLLTKALFKPYSAYHMAQIRKLQSMNRTGKRAEMVEEHGYDCYCLKTTEFLTNNGWKSFYDVLKTDKLATVNPKTGKLVFSKIIGKIEKDSVEVYEHNRSLSNFCITQNHNLLVSPCSRSPKNKFSTKFDKKHQNWELIPLNFILNGNVKNKDGNKKTYFNFRRSLNDNTIENKTISDEYLILAGLFLSEGTVNFYKNKVKCVTLSQTDKGKLEEFENLLNTTGYKYKKYTFTGREKIENSYVLDKKIANKLYSDFEHGSKYKKLPKWALKLSKRQFFLLWNSCICGDGYHHKNGSTLYTSSKKLADLLHASATLNGIIMSCRGPYKSRPSKLIPNGECDIYQLYIPKNQEKVKAVCINNKYFKKLETLTKVGCFETITGTLITRRKGKVAIQGNCKFAMHAYRLARQCTIVMKEGTLRPTLDPEDAKVCMDLRTGGIYDKDAALKLLEDVDKEMYSAYSVSTIQESPDFNKVNEFCVSLYREYVKNYVEYSTFDPVALVKSC